jgi:hypothetical protein
MNDSCIPHANGVPGMGGPPNWWDPVPAPGAPYTAASGWTAQNDPRWIGASGHGYDIGTGEEAQFRALFSTGSGSTPYYLYLSFEVNNDPTADAGYDGMLVGFQTQSGAGYVMDVKAYSATNSHDLDAGGTTIQWNKTGATYTDPSPPHTVYRELTNYAGAHPDVKAANWFRPPDSSTTNNRWAVCMRIPLLAPGGVDISADGINLGNVGSGASFKFWYAFWIEIGAPNALNYNWPRTAAVSADAALNLVVPDFPAWGDTHLGTSGPCGAGISLASADIGTNNIDPVTHLPAPNEILVSLTAPPTNHFFAAPLNNDPTQTVAAGSIEARFFTADWGSTALFTSSGGTPWQEMPFTKGAGTHFTNAAAFGPGTKGAIGFDWALSHDDAVKYLGDPTHSPPIAATKNMHECMLVTLSNFHTTPGNPGYEFLNDSTYRNMDFKQASAFTERVMISTAGARLTSHVAAGKPVSVFVYEERNNMPATIKAGLAPLPTVKTVLGARSSPLAMAHASNVPIHAFDRLANVLPTLRYHVYRSRSIQVRRRGTLHTLLEPQTSFGYFIQHTGPLYGWTPQLLGLEPKLGLRRVSGHVYEMQVPLHESVKMETAVTSIAKKPIFSLPISTKTTTATSVQKAATKTTVVRAPIAAIKNVISRLRIGG